ncbi:MAG: M16 family metallopeptidase [Chloroflexota bacterium]
MEKIPSAPPIAEGKLFFEFPHIEKISLNEHLEVSIYEDKTQPLFIASAIFSVGSLGESLPGLTSFTALMLTRGAAGLGAMELSEEVDRLGANLSASCNWENSYVTISALAGYSPEALEILSRCAMESDLPDEEVERLRIKVTADVRQYRSDPSYLAQYALNATIFKGHGYANPRIGTIESIAEITREQCVARYEQMKRTGKIKLILAGNFNREETLRLAEDLFSRRRETVAPVRVAVPDKFIGGKIALINKPEAVQSSLRMGKNSININHPDYPALQVVNACFGGYFMSRLNESLRERKGYTYGIHSYFDSRRDACNLVVASNLNTDSLVDSIATIKDEMRRIAAEPIPEEEARRAVQFMLGAFARSTETPMQIAGFIHNLLIHNLDYDYYNRLYSDIAEAKPEDIERVKGVYMAPENLVFAVSGELDTLVNILKELGEPELISTD